MATSTYDPGTQVDAADFLCLHRNENLFVGADWTIQAAQAQLERAAIALYPDPVCAPLRRDLADLYQVKLENVFVGNGSDEVLSDLLEALRAEYDTLLIPDVCFKVYHVLADRFRYRQEILPGDTFSTGRIESEGWQGLALLDSPNAISGSRAVDAQQVNDLAAGAGRFVIWDNVYGEYCHDQPPLLRPNTVLVRSFSKFYGLAALRVGYCIADEALVAALLARKDAFNVNGFGQLMAQEAIRRRQVFEGLADAMRRSRTELVAQLLNRDFLVHPSAANFVLVRHRRHTGHLLQQELLRRGVLVRRFPGPLTENHLRIVIPPPESAVRLISILDEVLRDLGQTGTL